MDQGRQFGQALTRVLGIFGGGVPPPGITPPGVVPPVDGAGGDGNTNPTATEGATPSSSAASSTAQGPTVTAIVDDDQPIYDGLVQGPFVSQGPLPSTDDSFDVSSSTTAASTTPSSTQAPPPITSTQAPPPPTTTAPPAASNTIGITPSGTNVNCLTGDSGARLGDCLALLGRFQADQKVCTSDSGVCLASGQSFCKASGGRCDPNGSDFIDISNYCMIAQNSGCAFVVANKESNFGFPGSSCFTGAQMDQYIRGAANQCAGNNALALQVGPNAFDSFCLLSQDSPGTCGA